MTLKQPSSQQHSFHYVTYKFKNSVDLFTFSFLQLMCQLKNVTAPGYGETQ